jgi:branched-subunit amino acid transport protein
MSKELYFFLALLVTAGVTYLIRALPLLLVRRRITSRFIRSFLYYVPYVVLSVLAFPAILYCTDSVLSGIAAAIACAVLAYCGKGLLTCMLGGVITVIIVQGISMLL